MCYKRNSSFLVLIKRENYICSRCQAQKLRKLGEFPSLLYPVSSFNKQCGQHRVGICFHTSTVLTTNLLVQYHLAIKTVTKMLYFENVNFAYLI